MSATDSIDWIAETETYLIPSYQRFPLVLHRGEGCYVEDVEGRRYLDFYGGHAVAVLGHSPPRVVQAIAAQAGELLFFSNVVYLEPQARAARALVELCRRPGARVFFCNSGAEANENALKIARAFTGRRRIVATESAFHGRTAGALAITGLPKYRGDGTGLPGDVTHVPFGDLEAAAAAVDGDTALVIVEPIQGMAGAVMPPPGYLAGLSEICRERGALLAFDELQTGMGRVGAPTAALAFGVEPALQTFAKALGSGVPAAAVVADAEVAAAIRHGDLGSTFGGGPLACAAVLATCEELSERRLWENAARMERLIRERLDLPGVAEIRGRGLLLGLVLDRPARPVRDALLARRILVGTAVDPNTLRLIPPLVVGEAEVEALREALSASLRETKPSDG
jgi:acetylornithine/succinyldiaminopimelate/putrescine aminotransferase